VQLSNAYSVARATTTTRRPRCITPTPFCSICQPQRNIIALKASEATRYTANISQRLRGPVKATERAGTRELSPRRPENVRTLPHQKRRMRSRLRPDLLHRQRALAGRGFRPSLALENCVARFVEADRAARQRPTSPANRPSDTDSRPADSNSRPVGSDSRRVDRDNRPPDSDTRSSDCDSRPTDSISRPFERNGRPSERDSRPLEGDKRPVEWNRLPPERGKRPLG
jgi:hypothetical protein